MITKAIIPAAGWGTRMLPITKTIEKSMLPVGARPVIDYIVQDIIAAGISDIYFVVNEQSSQLQDYYSSNTALNDYLELKGKLDLLPLVAPPENISFHFIVQPSTAGYGTSVPAGLTSEFISDSEQALMVLSDNIFYRKDGGSNAADLIRLVEQSGGSAGLFGAPVPKEDISKYGIIEKDDDNHFIRIIEKPKVEDAPSNLSSAGFYLFPKEIFDLAKQLPANPARGEFEITDAVNAYVKSGGDIVVGEVTGEYFDCGSPEGWLRANQGITGIS